MQAGINRRAVLDQLGSPVDSPLQAALANNSGVRSPFDAPGLQLPNESAAPLGASPAPAAAAPAPAADFSGQLEGFNADKLAANKNDPKYRFASIAKGYNVSDPGGRQALSDALAADTSGFFKGGLQGDMIQALDPATGQFGGVDVIRGLDAGGQGWQWGAEGPQQTTSLGAQASGLAGNPGLEAAQSNLSGLLQGSPYANIQNALGKMQQPNLQALIAQLGGGQ
ncbi:MAG TPA: hypothetical protein VK467_10320 [Gemmatimonadales bacterium]|nr:hypothetical protein [Gemmatimonadales bacterium]